MRLLFAWLGFAAAIVAVVPLGCANGSASPSDTDDGGASVDDASRDAAEGGGDCPLTCTESTPYCDRASRKCVACLPTHDTCPVTTYCQAQAGGGYKCAVGCKTSSADCAAIPDGGAAACCAHACVDVQSSTMNCGACGKQCSTNHVINTACSVGSCSGDCQTGYADCNNDKATDGCEVATGTDPKNCSGCGVACSTNHISAPTCSGGTCGGTCDPGWGDCNNDKQRDGCEASLSLPTSCGMCGMACAPANAVGAACTNAMCDYTTCNAGFQDCDGNRANGCESNKNFDSNNCGSCGNRCGAGMGCSQGVCVTAVGFVTNVGGTMTPIQVVPCGNGTVANCTQAVAESSCTAVGKKLVSHASDGTTSVVSLGATVSCHWSVSYYVNNSSALTGQCLIAMSNASWTQCCGVGSWHGNILTIPAAGQQYGYVYSTDSGYNAGMMNVTGATWGCIAKTSPPTPTTMPACTTFNVACE